MSMITELIERLRQHADTFAKSGFAVDGLVKDYREAADTIQLLSEKLHSSQTEPCEDCISRRAAVSVANDFDCGMVVRGLEKLPSVHLEQEVGKWITLKDEYGDVVEAVCSNCGRNGSHTWKYCPNCGKMKEVSDGNQGNKTNR